MSPDWCAQYKQKMADLNAEHREQIKEIREKTTEKVMEKPLKREARMKIRKTIRDISNLLNKGNKQNNVKAGMRDFVADALKSAEALFADQKITSEPTEKPLLG